MSLNKEELKEYISKMNEAIKATDLDNPEEVEKLNKYLKELRAPYEKDKDV